MIVEMKQDKIDCPVTGPKAWLGLDFASDTSWQYRLTPGEISEIETALAANRKFIGNPTAMERSQFKLPELSKTLSRLNRELENGRGFSLIRGLPVGKWTLDETKLVYWGLGLFLGRMIVQDNMGKWIHDVYDAGGSFDNIKVRGYSTNAQLTPHCDSGDLVTLLCYRPAKEGGLNTIASFHSVYNKILSEHPEYLAPLFRGFHYNIRGGGPEGTPFEDVTKHRVPVFSITDGLLSGRYNQKAILTSAEYSAIPPFSELEKAAINSVAEYALADDVRFDLMLEAGDVLLLNNNDILHTRSSFVDSAIPEEKRWFLRLWIVTPIGRSLPNDFADHYNTGPREGPAVRQEAFS